MALLRGFLEDLIQWKLDSQNGRWHLQFDFNHGAFQRLLTYSLGRTLLLTNRTDWTAEEILAGYSCQQQVEQVFRGLRRDTARGHRAVQQTLPQQQLAKTLAWTIWGKQKRR